jgi:hypothetical protein
MKFSNKGQCLDEAVACVEHNNLRVALAGHLKVEIKDMTMKQIKATLECAVKTRMAAKRAENKHTSEDVIIAELYCRVLGFK